MKKSLVDEIFFNDSHYANSCKDKKKYENEWQAKFAADEQYEHNAVKLSWYHCQFCDKWHLTSEL